MASLDSLPPDQRAVLDLVLQRGRSYDDIARLLAIDRAAVRARALAAFDEIGPDTGLAPEARALITDYLLGQLPAKVAEQTRDRLAESPYERAWARVLASELGPVASKPLPEIPEGTARARASADEASSKPAAQTSTMPEARPPRRPERDRESRRRIPRPTDRPSSRRGGVIFLLAGTVVVIVVVLVLIVVLSSGKSNNSSSTGTVAAGTTTSTPSTTTPSGGTGTTGTATTGTGTTGTSTVKPKVIGQVNMNTPSGSGAAKGAALVVQEGTSTGIILEASGLEPNSHNAYAVWLSNTPTDSTRLGFVNQAVGKNGRLETGGALPANATHYTKLLLTLETQSNPKTPGPVVLQGPFKITGS
jgi:hypothetical protein